MTTLDAVRWFATGGAVIAAIIVAARLTPRITGYGFVIFTTSSLAWIAAGIMDDTASLVVQNVVLTVVNVFGAWRWLVERS